MLLSLTLLEELWRNRSKKSISYIIVVITGLPQIDHMASLLAKDIYISNFICTYVFFPSNSLSIDFLL